MIMMLGIYERATNLGFYSYRVLCMLPVYVTDLLNLIFWDTDGRQCLRMRDLEFAAAVGLTMSIHDGWLWESDDQMWSATLVLVEGNLGWYKVVDVEFPQQD